MKYGYEQWLKHKIELNIDQIWKDYKSIDKLLTTEKEYLLNNNKLSIYSALVNMITGDYVKRAWSNTEDPGTHSLTHSLTYSLTCLIRGTCKCCCIG